MRWPPCAMCCGSWPKPCGCPWQLLHGPRLAPLCCHVVAPNEPPPCCPMCAVAWPYGLWCRVALWCFMAPTPMAVSCSMVVPCGAALPPHMAHTLSPLSLSLDYHIYTNNSSDNSGSTSQIQIVINSAYVPQDSSESNPENDVPDVPEDDILLMLGNVSASGNSSAIQTASVNNDISNNASVTVLIQSENHTLPASTPFSTYFFF
ncbi:hypothetical protein NE237_006770 [Protea cynaroides]|uniref:Uncharacterized protein n=1 Tax=Protea cynaroides TaxID=273540 RepID=A0A9Q0KNV3_9MAGN|nr:hypothetical protein NE237_006770 [Protea cynaroides]